MTTPEKRRLGRPGYDLDTLLPIAVEVFNERGFDGTSMDDLAKRLGIGKSAIYHHVPSKDALLGLALDRALDGLAEVAERARALDAPAVVRLEKFVHDTVVLLCDELPYVTLLLRLHGNTEIERRALARRRQFDNLGADLVKEAIGDGDLRPDIDARITARLLFGLVNSLVEWYRPRRRSDAEKIADAVVAIAFQGLRIETRSTR
jgi:AcrR family transcriptional regulator